VANLRNLSLASPPAKPAGFKPASNEQRPLKKKIAKFILLVVCGLVAYAAISAVLRAREEKTLKAEIADIRRSLREQGFKTEFDDFKITTDAAMKARVAALLALGYEPKLNTNDDRLDIRPIASNGVATIIWKQDPLSLYTNTLQWADFRAALNRQHDGLDAACEAALQGPIQSDVDITAHVFPWGERLSDLHRLSRTLGDRALLELHDGHPDEAWTNLLAATRLVTAWHVEPVPISCLIRATMMDNNYALTWQALQFNHWPDDRLAILQREWEAVDFFTNLPEIFGIERLDDFNYCQQLLQNPPSGTYPLLKIAKNLLDDPSEALREAERNYQRTHYRGNKVLNDEKNLLLYFRDRELELRRAVQSPTWAEMQAQPGITNQAQFKSPSPAIASMAVTGARFAFLLAASAAEAEAQRRIIITAIALERYRGKYGSYPNLLAQLTPEFLKVPLPDFMDGQPLRYRPTNDGHFLLYSIGPDCVDDGGRQIPPDAQLFPISKDGTYGVMTNVDLVWPIPATP
jgi:hypothetical protein